jgi:hypothetical protein
MMKMRDTFIWVVLLFFSILPFAEADVVKLQIPKIDELVKENVAKFDLSYKDKLIETNGVVKKIGSKLMDLEGKAKEVYIISLESENCNMMYVFEKAEEVASLKPGDKIELEGWYIHRTLRDIYFTSPRILTVNNHKIVEDLSQETKPIQIQQYDSVERLTKLTEGCIREAKAIKNEIRASEHRKMRKAKAKREEALNA